MADDSYAFEIVGSAEKADKAVDGVLNKLDLIGPRATRASSELQGAFDHAETILRKFDQALASNSNTSLKQTQALSQAARAQAAYIEQLQREAQMLEGIHGPAQKAAQDIETLTSLLAKGAINASEFNQKLAAIRPPSNFTSGGGGAGGGGLDLGGALGGLPGGSLIAGAIGGGVGGAATAGLQMAAGSVHEIIEMSDAYLGLENRLKALTGSQQAADELFDRLHVSANKTRSDINSTASSFIQFSRATRDLGLNQNQVLAFTEHLNEAISMSGADAAGAQAGLLQLSQAMASGALRGQDLHSVMEQIPIVAQVIQDHLHVTAGKFKEMADNGQISAKVIIDAFNEAGPALEQSFGNTAPTIGQQFQVLKNDITVAVGEMAKEIDLSKMAGDTIASLKIGIEGLGLAVKGWSDELGLAGIKFTDLTRGGLQDLKMAVDFFGNVDYIGNFFDKGATKAQHFSNVQDVINRVVAEGTGKLREYDEEMIKFTLRMAGGEGMAKAFADAVYRAAHAADGWNDAAYKGETINSRIVGLLDDGAAAWEKLTKKQTAHHAALSEEDKLYKQIHGSVDQAYQDLAGLEVLYAKRRISLGLYNYELQKQIDLLSQARLLELEGLGGVHVMPTAGLGQKADEGPNGPGNGGFSQSYMESLSTTGIDKVAFEKGLAEFKAGVDKFNAEVAKNADKAARQTQEAWASALGGIGRSFMDAALAGQESFSKMTEHMLRDIALLTLKMGALEMIKAGGTVGLVGTFATGLLGGANGFDYLGTGSGLQLPGFATGGDMIMRGGGGTDSQLAMWWMTPGESLHVRTPEQRRAAADAAQGDSGGTVLKPEFKLLMPRDDRAIVDDSRRGLRTLVKLKQQIDRDNR